MAHNSDRSEGSPAPDGPAVWPGIWVVATISCLGLLVVGGGRFGIGTAIAASALVLVAAFYLSRRPAAPLPGTGPDASLNVPPPGEAAAGEVIADVISALPDPTVLLDSDGRVITLNAQASAIAPALRRGEPALLGLRIPEVVEAVRRAGLSNKTERAEFNDRVPSERWFEVIVVPIPSRTSGPQRGAPRMVLSFRDLTPIRRVEEMRVDFVANASHE